MKLGIFKSELKENSYFTTNTLNSYKKKTRPNFVPTWVLFGDRTSEVTNCKESLASYFKWALHREEKRLGFAIIYNKESYLQSFCEFVTAFEKEYFKTDKTSVLKLVDGDVQIVHITPIKEWFTSPILFYILGMMAQLSTSFKYNNKKSAKDNFLSIKKNPFTEAPLGQLKQGKNLYNLLFKYGFEHSFVKIAIKNAWHYENSSEIGPVNISYEGKKFLPSLKKYRRYSKKLKWDEKGFINSVLSDSEGEFEDINHSIYFIKECCKTLSDDILKDLFGVKRLRSAIIPLI